MKQLGELGQGDVLFLSGSIPSSMPDDAYQKIMAMLDGRGVRIAVDATRDLLMKVLPYHPFLIKPNKGELEEIYGVSIYSKEDIEKYARKLQQSGAENVLVSLGKDGAMLLDCMGQVHYQNAPQGKLINSVGSGDSMVAGFLAGYIQSDSNYLEALKMGVAAGSASAFSRFLATKKEIIELKQQI